MPLRDRESYQARAISFDFGSQSAAVPCFQLSPESTTLRRPQQDLSPHTSASKRPATENNEGVAERRGNTRSWPQCSLSACPQQKLWINTAQSGALKKYSRRRKAFIDLVSSSQWKSVSCPKKPCGQP